MSPLSDRIPRSDKVLFVLYDFKTTQNTKRGDTLFEHVPNLVCAQFFCATCEDDADVEVDCRRNSFWTDPIDDLFSYVLRSRPWADRIVAIAHNAKVFDLFVFNRLLEMKMMPQLLIMNG
jgi:hypothetical protein